MQGARVSNTSEIFETNLRHFFKVVQDHVSSAASDHNDSVLVVKGHLGDGEAVVVVSVVVLTDLQKRTNFIK